MNTRDLDDFVEALQKVCPDIRVRFKDSSWTQKILGVLLRPIVPNFMTAFTTVIGSTIYFPSETYYYSDPKFSFGTLAHEFVHVWDAKQTRWFRLKYLFPQILAVIPLVAFVVLAWPHGWIVALLFTAYILGALAATYSMAPFVLFMLVSALATLILGWLLAPTALLALLGLVVLAPWPSPMRLAYEVRGYGANLAISQWMYGRCKPTEISSKVDLMVGPGYYYMGWRREPVERALVQVLNKAALGSLQHEMPYAVTHAFLASRDYCDTPL